MSAPGIRAALMAGGAFAIAVAGASFANALDTNTPIAGAQEVNFADEHGALQQSSAPSLNVSASDSPTERFSQPALEPPGESPREMELSLSAGGDQTGAPFDVSINQRASFGADSAGDLNHRARGSEVRVGRNLVNQRREQRSNDGTVYAFVSSDDQALTWRPGTRSEFGGSSSSFALQDQVQVGDHAAGVTYERNGVQASVAYVERETDTRVGHQTFHEDQNFAGVTVTMRH